MLLVVENDTVLVVCDWLSKIVHCVVTTEVMTAKGLARFFRDNIWKLHGLPESMISDKEPQFVVELTSELNKMLGIEMILSIVFHLQMNGQIEQMNQELEQYLRFFIEYRQRDWPE